MMRSIPIFNTLCEQTLFLILFEITERRIFEHGELIMPMAKRSPLNKKHYAAQYAPRLTKAQAEMLTSVPHEEGGHITTEHERLFKSLKTKSHSEPSVQPSLERRNTSYQQQL